MTIDEEILDFQSRCVSNWYRIYDDKNIFRYYAVRYWTKTERFSHTKIPRKFYIYLLDPRIMGNARPRMGINHSKKPLNIELNGAMYHIKPKSKAVDFKKIKPYLEKIIETFGSIE